MADTVLFVFNGDPMCFIHVLLNALDLKAADLGGRIVIEGAATGLIGQLAKTDHPLHTLWEKVKAADLIEGVCFACSKKLDTLEAARQQHLALLDDMNGHPGMARFQRAGATIVTF